MVTPFSTVQKSLVQRKLREQLFNCESLNSFSSLYVVKSKRQQSLSHPANANGSRCMQEDNPTSSFKRQPLAFCLQTKLRQAAEQAACSIPQATLHSSSSVQNLCDLALNQTFAYTLRTAKAMAYTALKRLDNISNPVQMKKMLTALNKDACTRCRSVLVPGVTCKLVKKSSSRTTIKKKRLFTKASKCPCIIRKCFFCGCDQAIAWKPRETSLEKPSVLKPKVDHMPFPLLSCMKNKKQKKMLADTALFQTSLVTKPEKNNTARRQCSKKICGSFDLLNERSKASQHSSFRGLSRPQVQSTCTATQTSCVKDEFSVLSILNSFFSNHGI